MKHKFFKIGLALTILIIALVVVIYKTHPIILKWVLGEARIIGKPINAKIYTDGKLDNKISIYKVASYWNGENTDDYLLKLEKFDKYGMLKFINIDLKEGWIGRPVGTSDDCYDIINGYLFQSEVGGHFSDFKDEMKGYNFDPKLRYQDKQIKFHLPPHVLNFDLITIELR